VSIAQWIDGRVSSWYGQIPILVGLMLILNLFRQFEGKDVSSNNGIIVAANALVTPAHLLDRRKLPISHGAIAPKFVVGPCSLIKHRSEIIPVSLLHLCIL
jgi:hypothetical protein